MNVESDGEVVVVVVVDDDDDDDDDDDASTRSVWMTSAPCGSQTCERMA